jgi:uncharacterized membrane-anchored protein
MNRHPLPHPPGALRRAHRALAAWLAATSVATLLALALAPAGARAADDAASAPANPLAREADAAMEAARAVAKNGPADVPLGAQGLLHLPEGQTFIPLPQALRLLQSMGNPGQDPNLLGLVFPRGESAAHWFMTVRFMPAGYVKDDDAKDWNADDMLKSIREGTEATNQERTRIGVSTLEILGWAEPPHYDASTHRLLWSMRLRESDAPKDAPLDVNYNTYALGRDGYFSLNLITSEPELAALRPVAAAELAALAWSDGKAYADFNAKTDHVAEYGLAALVVGVAAKKLGLLAVVGLFLVKFAKVGLIALAALGGGFMKYFKRKPAALASPAVADVGVVPATTSVAPPASGDGVAGPDTVPGFPPTVATPPGEGRP